MKYSVYYRCKNRQHFQMFHGFSPFLFFCSLHQ